METKKTKVVKPIFIAFFPVSKNNGQVNTKDELEEIRNNLLKSLNYEYHVIGVYSSGHTGITFQCLNPNDLSTIDIEPLKKQRTGLDYIITEVKILLENGM